MYERQQIMKVQFYQVLLKTGQFKYKSTSPAEYAWTSDVVPIVSYSIDILQVPANRDEALSQVLTPISRAKRATG